MAASSDFDPVVPARTGPAPRDLKKAIDYLRRNMSRQIATADLAAACGVAERTLRKHFRAFVGLAPLEYLRRLRLAAVREDLLHGATGTSVTEDATRYGFSHFGRFSSLYRRCFGEAPSSTLARGRAEVESDKAGRRETLSGSLRLSREKPSLAVLPCQVSRAESGHRFFAQSIAEGIATALCRARSISVQGPHPSRSAASHDPQRLVRYLGVRYVLIGRMAENAGRIRIIMRLLEVATNTQIWGDSYDGEAGHLFALQDRVTEGVVKAILPGIRGAEIERVRRKRPEDLGVYELTVQAFPFVFASNPNATRQAIDLLHRALEIDPDYALSIALAAWCHAQLAVHNGTPSPREEKRRALLLSERAAILDSDDPQVLTARCSVHTIAGQFDVAAALIHRALALDPTSGWAWERSAWLKTFSGEPEAGIAHFGEAMRLDPLCPSNANRFVGFGCAHFDSGRYDRAAFWMRKAVQEQPSTVWVHRSLSVSCARLGERLAALDSLDALQRYSPDLTIGQVLASLPFTPDFMGRVADGLDDLGLPP